MIAWSNDTMGTAMARGLVAAAVLAAAAPAVAAPQESAPRTGTTDPVTVPPEIAVSMVYQMGELNGTLQRIHVVLDRLLVQQELDLLMKRIDLKVRATAPLQDEVRDVRAEIESREQEVLHMETFRTQMEESIAAARERGDDATTTTGSGELRKIDDNLELSRRRLAELQQKLIELENDLARHRDEIEDLEYALDERLGLR